MFRLPPVKITAQAGGGVRHRRSRRFAVRVSRGAFTFVETLAALLIVVALSGTLALAGNATTGRFARDNPKKEAHRLARWLSKNIITANRTGRAFAFFCSGSVAQENLEIRWSDGAKDRYAAAYGCRFLRRGGGFESLWSPQWNTLTPAFTLRVTNGRGADDHFVVVSAHGRVRTDFTPP